MGAKKKRNFSDKALLDFDLIDQAIEGDQQAYAKLMERYKNSVYFMLLKMVKNTDDAEDLTIEAFTKAFKNLPKFKKEYTFSTWLFRIATNNCIDFIRKKRLETTSLHTPFTNDSGDAIVVDVPANNLNPAEKAIKLEENSVRS